jgi:hypothetical protein
LPKRNLATVTADDLKTENDNDANTEIIDQADEIIRSKEGEGIKKN